MPTTQKADSRSERAVPVDAEDMPQEDVVSLRLPRKRVVTVFDVDVELSSLPKRKPFVAAITEWEEDGE